MKHIMKHVVITGASSGIGLACVKASLAAGHKVIATARKADDLAMLKELGATPVELELCSEFSVKRAARQCLELTDNNIHALFNNAGYGLQIALEDTSWEDMEAQYQGNVIGPVQFTNHLLPAMRPGSKLIFNSSILGLITVPFRGPYCMSKHALEAAADAYRLELKPLEIDVHVIQPGPIEARFRPNALKVLQHALQDKQPRLDYSNHIARLSSSENTKGTLPASSVADIYLGIVEGRLRKPHYLVTGAAKAAALLKRLLGHRFDGIVLKSEPVRERSQG